MWGASLKPNVQVDSNRDCGTQARAMLQVKHIIWLIQSNLHTDINLPLSFPFYTCFEGDQSASYLLRQSLKEDEVSGLGCGSRGSSWCSWYGFTGWVKPQLPAALPLFTSMDLVLTCYTRACFAVTSNTNM